MGFEFFVREKFHKYFIIYEILYSWSFYYSKQKVSRMDIATK